MYKSRIKIIEELEELYEKEMAILEVICRQYNDRKLYALKLIKRLGNLNLKAAKSLTDKLFILFGLNTTVLLDEEQYANLAEEIREQLFDYF